MSRRTCRKCYFYELCRKDDDCLLECDECEDYTPIDDPDDGEVKQLVEKYREYYQKAWNTYIKRDD